jgi:hypothetical protein
MTGSYSGSDPLLEVLSLADPDTNCEKSKSKSLPSSDLLRNPRYFADPYTRRGIIEAVTAEKGTVPNAITGSDPGSDPDPPRVPDPLRDPRSLADPDPKTDPFETAEITGSDPDPLREPKSLADPAPKSDIFETVTRINPRITPAAVKCQNSVGLCWP